MSLLENCELVFSVKLHVMGVSDDFSELALNVMLMYNLQLPNTVHIHEAMDLFVDLVELMGL